MQPQRISNTYECVYKKLRRARGKARFHTCVDCGGQAAEWSWTGRGSRPY